MSESPILRPEEVARRRSETTAKKIEEQKQSEKVQEIQNTAGLVKINYESMGRFGTPETLYFDDFVGRHVNDIELSTQDNLLENLVTILNELKKNEESFDIKDMTSEDLLETLIAIKQQFEGDAHIHYWICDCQMEKSDKDRIINEYQLRLSELQFKSMLDVDKEMKEYMTEVFASMSDEQFKQYLIQKYKKNPLDDIDLHTREKEVESIIVKEPFNILSGQDVYSIRYPRVDDIIKAKKYTEKIYNPKIKTIQNRREANVPLHELKAKKDLEIETLKEEQAKTLVLFAKAMMLQTKNDIPLSDNDKMEEFKNMKRQTTRNIENLFDILKFGLSTELELICPICGQSEKRLLRDSIDPRQLLPLNYKQSDTGDASKRNVGVNTGFNFYFGV
jgi:hypothetical protein